MPNPRQDWLVWQLADSAFPAGGFGHSGGLEAAWQLGEVRTETQLAGFLEASLHQFGQAAMPFVNDAHRDPQRLMELDLLCDVFTANHVANRASRALGQAFLSSVERAFPSGAMSELRSQVREMNGHFAPVFGVVTRLLEIQRSLALRLYLFQQLRGAVSAAVRLGIAGPIAAQALQHRLSAVAEEVAAGNAQRSTGEIAQTAPLLDIFQGTQDRLYSRLFQS